MRHSVFAGGKRLRPVLCLEAARMIAGSGQIPQGVEESGRCHRNAAHLFPDP